MKKFLKWIKDILNIKNILKALEQALEEVSILKNALEGLSNELEDIRALNIKYKAELEELRNKDSDSK